MGYWDLIFRIKGSTLGYLGTGFENISIIHGNEEKIEEPMLDVLWSQVKQQLTISSAKRLN